MAHRDLDDDLLRARSVWVVDLDGVVYAGAALLPGAGEAVARLRAAGRRVAFLTNNSARASADVARKLAALGVPCEPGGLMTSAAAAARWLAARERPGGRGVHVMGTDALRGEVEAQGVALATGAEADTVLVGFDPGFTYEKLAAAFTRGRGGATLVACNRDREYPVDDGALRPACAAMLGALEESLGRRAEATVGKPSRYMLDLLAADMGFALGECVVVGDTPDSDLVMAASAGVPGAWVRGEVTLASLAARALR